MTEVKTKKVQLARAAKIEGEHYAAGATFEGDSKLVADLIASGVAEDPKAVSKEAPSEIEAAEQRAKEILAEAEAEAAQAVETAKTTAEGIVAEAKAEAERVLTAAQADADKVAEEAKAKATEAASKAAESNKKIETDSKSK